MSQPSASLLNLPDELWGLIYERIDSTDSKRAFRHSHSSIYRSSAVNAHLTSVSVSTTTKFFPCIAAFPQPATLRRLELKGSGDRGAILLGSKIIPEEQRAAAFQRMASVQHLCIEDCDLERECCAHLEFSFPKLRDGSEEARLELVGCGMDAAALGWCTEKFRLRHLYIRQPHRNGLPESELFRLLSRAQSLESLEVQLFYAVTCDVTPLSALRHLHTLKLFSVVPLHLDVVLSALPALTVLGIDYSALEGGEPLASHTIKELLVPMVPVSKSGFTPALTHQFPALQEFVIGGIDFQSGEFVEAVDVHASEDEVREHLERVAQMVTWLLGLPLQSSSSFLHTYATDAFSEVHAFGVHRLGDCRQEHAAACLQALSPLNLSSVKVILAGWLEVGPHSISALTNIFCGAEKLFIYGDANMPLGRCSLLCVRRLLLLHEIKLDLLTGSADEVVDDLLAPLMEAWASQRRLELCVVEEQGSRNWSFLEALAHQWDASMQLLSRGPQIKLLLEPAA